MPLLVPEYFIISFLWSVFHKPGLGPRKENTELSTSPLACSPTNGKKKRIISVFSSFSKCSQHAKGSHMASELSHPFRVRQDLKLPVILRKWTSSHLWRWAMRHLSWQTCPQGSSWYLLHPCIQKDGREGKDSDTLIQVTMLGYSLFSTIVFKMYLR